MRGNGKVSKVNMNAGDHFEQTAANILIDFVGSFQYAKDDAERWAVANRAAATIGAKSLLIGGFRENELLPAWARANIDEDWGTYYHENSFCDVDLVLLNRKSGRLSDSHRAGSTAVGQGVSAKSVEWCNGMREAGYGGHIMRLFDGTSGLSQTLVSFMPASDEGEDAFRMNTALVTGIAALVAAYIGPPTIDGDAGHMICGYQELSTREREVVSLLAEGLNTARIAEKLGIAEVTVQKHFKGARIKMGASNRAQTLALAMVRNQINL